MVQGGSEAALITSFRSAEQNKKALLAYFYEPQWFFNEVKLVRVNLPAYDLNKVVSTKFATSGSPAYTVIKNFQWSNENQNEVSKSIAVDKLSDDDAAKKFFDAHPDLMTAWLAGTGKS